MELEPLACEDGLPQNPNFYPANLHSSLLREKPDHLDIVFSKKGKSRFSRTRLNLSNCLYPWTLPIIFSICSESCNIIGLAELSGETVIGINVSHP